MAKVQAIFHEAAARVFGRVAHRRRTLPGYANPKVKGALKEWRKAQAAVHGLTGSALRKAQARKKVAKKNWLAAKGEGLQEEVKEALVSAPMTTGNPRCPLQQKRMFKMMRQLMGTKEDRGGVGGMATMNYAGCVKRRRGSSRLETL